MPERGRREGTPARPRGRPVVRSELQGISGQSLGQRTVHADDGRRDLLRMGSLAFGGLNLPGLLAARTSEVRHILHRHLPERRRQPTGYVRSQARCARRYPRQLRLGPDGGARHSFSGLLPRTAEGHEQVRMIRSMHSDEAIHERARQYIFSGTRPRNDLLQPSYGAVMAKELGPRRAAALCGDS